MLGFHEPFRFSLSPVWRMATADGAAFVLGERQTTISLSLRPSLMYTQVYDDPSRDTRRHTVSNGSIECFLLSLVLC